MKYLIEYVKASLEGYLALLHATKMLQCGLVSDLPRNGGPLCVKKKKCGCVHAI